MASRIAVPVLWDENNNFLGGQLQTISTDSIVFGVAQKPSGVASLSLTNVLQVKDPSLGTLFLTLTPEQYLAAINVAVNIGRRWPASGSVTILSDEVDVYSLKQTDGTLVIFGTTTVNINTDGVQEGQLFSFKSIPGSELTINSPDALIDGLSTVLVATGSSLTIQLILGVGVEGFTPQFIVTANTAGGGGGEVLDLEIATTGDTDYTIPITARVAPLSAIPTAKDLYTAGALASGYFITISSSQIILVFIVRPEFGNTLNFTLTLTFPPL